MTAFFEFLSSSKRPFIHGLRISIFVVMAWIGGLKAFQYEADGIVPFVANSPFMSFFYQKNTSDADSYKQHKNKEGEVVPQNIKWHQSNGTYVFSYALGTVIFLIGTLVLLGIWLPRVGVLGGLLTFGMSLVTLSFLITTPETWVADLGGPDHGFPFLSAAGRLVIKDIIMLFGGLVCASDAAGEVLRRKSLKSIAMD
ncbi:DUF417 family protein [Chryseobacterium sp. A321]